MHIGLSRGRIWTALAVIALVGASLRVAAVAAAPPLTPVSCATIIANPHGDYSFSSVSGCNFSGLNMEGVRFFFSTLNGVNFSGADLKNADFSEATLNSDNFSYANLEGSTFCFATLNGTNMSYAYVLGTGNGGWHTNVSDNLSHLRSSPGNPNGPLFGGGCSCDNPLAHPAVPNTTTIIFCTLTTFTTPF